MSVLDTLSKAILFLKSDRLSKKEGGTVTGDVNFETKPTINDKDILSTTDIASATDIETLTSNSALVTPLLLGEYKTIKENLKTVTNQNANDWNAFSGMVAGYHVTNAPHSDYHVFFNLRVNSTNCIQIAISISGADIGVPKIRNQTNNSWTAWKKVSAT